MNTERGFKVVVLRQGKRNIHYPANGHPLLNGQEALDLMETMSSRELSSVAVTDSNGEEETLDLTEMRNIYAPQNPNH